MLLSTRLSLALCFLLLAFSSAVKAQTPHDAGAESEARIHFNLAQRYYQTGRFAEAAREFRAAYELTQLSDLLYNAFLAYREAGDYDAAISALEAYIPEVSDPIRRRGFEARLARVRELRERVRRNEAPVGETVPDEATAEATTEPPEDSAADEGPNAEAINDEEHAAPEEGAEALDAEAPSSVSAAPWIVASAGGAMVVAGIVTGAFALSANSDLDGSCTAAGCEAGYQDTQDRGRALAISTDVLLFGGIAVTAAGLLWGLLRDDPSADEPSASAACLPGGCQAFLSGTF